MNKHNEMIMIGTIIGIIFISLVIGVAIGENNLKNNLKNKCIAKYSDMSHNKVDEHCKNILKFEV